MRWTRLNGVRWDDFTVDQHIKQLQNRLMFNKKHQVEILFDIWLLEQCK